MGISVEHLDAVPFPMARLPGSGYERSAVDDILDQVRERVAQGQPVDDLLAAVRFPIGRRQGYAASEVDDFLDRLAPGASLQTSGPVSPSVIKPLPEEPGFFGRLFGRR